MRDPFQTTASIRRFQLAGGEYEVLTRPSYPYWDEISPASTLAGKYIDITPGDKILLIGSEQGALALSIAQRSDPGELWIMEDNTHAMQMIASNLERQGLSHGRVHDQIELPPDTDGSFDRVVILARRGRNLARRQLRIAHQALKPGGTLAVAGEKRAGIQTFLKDAGELFGEVSVLGYKKGHRIGACVKKPQDARNPEWLTLGIIRRDGRHRFSVELQGEEQELVSIPGVFSYDHLDEGTDLLLEYSGEMAGERVLDLGCGYGVLGLQAALCGAAHVDLVDISLAALTCARENLERLGIANGRVLSAPSFEDENPEQYDLVLMNPPFHSGKEVNYNLPAHLIQGAHRALRRGGRLTLVANRFIRYERQMGEIFRRAEIIAHTGKFHIIRGTK